MMLWHWSLPNEILILDPYVFSSAALGNLLFSTLLCNTPISDLLLPQIKYLPISPEILGSSPTGISVGELANHKHTYKLFVGTVGQSQYDNISSCKATNMWQRIS